MEAIRQDAVLCAYLDTGPIHGSAVQPLVDEDDSTRAGIMDVVASHLCEFARPKPMRN
jgi:hypothetical protein